jgi:hypothetical protein
MLVMPTISPLAARRGGEAALELAARDLSEGDQALAGEGAAHVGGAVREVAELEGVVADELSGLDADDPQGAALGDEDLAVVVDGPGHDVEVVEEGPDDVAFLHESILAGAVCEDTAILRGGGCRIISRRRPAEADNAAVELPAIESLRCFVAAAERLNFRGAAKVVGLTPAALSQRIRVLEEQLGAALFQRTTRSVQLTPAGLALLPRARVCLAEAAACVRVARGDGSPAPVELTLGTRFELGMSWIVPLLPGLRAALPHLTLNLCSRSSTLVWTDGVGRGVLPVGAGARRQGLGGGCAGGRARRLW